MVEVVWADPDHLAAMEALHQPQQSIEERVGRLEALHARGATRFEELERRLEEVDALARRLEVVQDLQQQQQAMEVRLQLVEEQLEEGGTSRLRMEERMQQVEDRVAIVEESLLKGFGRVMPKVEELLAKFQSPGSATFAGNTFRPGSEHDVPIATSASVPTKTHESSPVPPSACISCPPVPQSATGSSSLGLPSATAPSSSAIGPLPQRQLISAPRVGSNHSLHSFGSFISSFAVLAGVTLIQFLIIVPLLFLVIGDLPEKLPSPHISPFLQNVMKIYLQASSNQPPASLHAAAVLGDVAVLERMLLAGGRVDVRDSRGNTALHLAASHGHVEAVDFLITKGAQIDSSGERARTPLLCAAAGGQMTMVAHLLAAGANLESEDAECATSLAVAVAEGHENVTEFLLGKGASVEKVDKNGETPLHRAVRGGHLAIVTLLVLQGASPRMENMKGESPVYLAAKVGFGTALAEMWKVVYPSEEEMERCLSVAGSAAVVWVTVDMARDLVLAAAGEKALRDAASDGRLEVLEALMQAGVDVNAGDPYGWAALHSATQNAHSSCIRALLQGGADPNLKTTRGTVALHLAARAGHIHCIRELLKGGAERNLKNAKGKTALELARDNNQAESLKLLQYIS